MAKRLSDIKKVVKAKEGDFLSYLEHLVGEQVKTFMYILQSVGDVYIFSGVIRNYFLGSNEVRDVDVMIDTTFNIESLISQYKHRKNSYGGYKVFIDTFTIDLWYLKDTWALHNHQMILDIEVERYIPYTAFFNFSSVLYSCKEKEFIYTLHFLRFLRDRKIDYAFEPNADYALCVVNTFYYESKLKLKIAENLKRHLQKLDALHSDSYEKVQLKHFGRLLYSKQEIQSKIASL